MVKQRKGPEKSATLYKIGTKKIGNDGNIWIIAENKNSVKRWTLFRKPSKKSLKETNTNYTIRFCEPTVYVGTKRRRQDQDFVVTPQFYKILNTKPVSIDERTPNIVCEGNGYIFGKLYPQNQYVKIGSMANDAGQVGLIDITNVKQKELDDMKTIHDKLFSGSPSIFDRYGPNWFNSEILAFAKSISPRILFIGDTVGGDVGANLWAHFSNKEIDSLIVDNSCMFP